MPRNNVQGSSFPSFKKIAIGFIVLAVILLVFIVYFSFAKATIILTLSQEPKTISFDLTVSPEGVEDNLKGRIISQELEVSQDFTVENYKEEPGTATGQIKIINNHTRNQPLVRTTRFLSPQNILFRLEKTVNVPAGGELVADVYADEQGAKFNIEPASFTIPGLSAALQQKIYGISESAMTGGIKKIGILNSEDIERGIDETLNNVNEEIKQQLAEQLVGTEVILDDLIKTEILDQSISDEIGQEVDKFTVTLKIKAIVVALDYEEFLNAAKEKYKEKNVSGESVLSWNVDEFEYNIKGIDTQNNTATVHSKLSADVSSTFNLDTFNKAEIAGFDAKGIEYYFSQYPGIQQVEVSFWPFWVKSAPALVDRINIEIK